MTLLRVDGISKSFKGLRAVDEVSFEVAEGSILGVIGANGAGKTTVFNLIAGALRPDTGRVYLGGREITGHAPHKVTAAGMTRRSS